MKYQIIDAIKSHVSDIGGFTSLPINIRGGDQYLVTTCDGVGTKLRLAITNPKWLDTIGQDLVAMCVNDILCAGATPLQFMDYLAFSNLPKEDAVRIIAGIRKACDLAKVQFVGGETAEMEGWYHNGDFELAGFATGLVKEKDLKPKGVKAGDWLVGLLSNGPHSNGFTLLRKLREKAAFQEQTYEEKDKWLDWMMQPTKIYTSVLSDLDNIKALAHITGGGIYNKLPRIIPPGHHARLFKPWDWMTLEWHRIMGFGNFSKRDLFSNFNCGIGMVVVIEPQTFNRLRYLNCPHIGTIEKNDDATIQWES